MPQFQHPSRVYLLNKESGLSSFQALSALKERIGTKRVGHTGTLDPFATGLLIAMTGRMTKAAQFVVDLAKEYEATLQFGEETDTLDCDGVITARGPIPEYSVIARAAQRFVGEISQVPPSYSALKINGTRAYQHARKGNVPALSARWVHVYELDILSWHPPHLSIRLKCSKGTYIRAIARDMGLACDSRAHCIALRRTFIGPFSVDMISSDGMTAQAFCAILQIPTLTVGQSIVKAMSNGQSISTIREFSPPDAEKALICDEQGREVALLAMNRERWEYRMVFTNPHLTAKC